VGRTETEVGNHPEGTRLTHFYCYEAKAMQLKYRGVNYDYTPPQVAAKPTGVVGAYRGLEWRFRAVTQSPVQQPTLDLVYRGATYQTGQTSEMLPEPAVLPRPVAAASGVSVKDRARALMLGHHAFIKSRQQSMLGRVAAEVGLEDASHYWSPIQGKVHSGFRDSYDRKHAALS
jgi:hypothetical protein